MRANAWPPGKSRHIQDHGHNNGPCACPALWTASLLTTTNHTATASATATATDNGHGPLVSAVGTQPSAAFGTALRALRAGFRCNRKPRSRTRSTVTDSATGLWYRSSGRSLRLLRDGPAGLREGSRCNRKLSATDSATATPHRVNFQHMAQTRSTSSRHFSYSVVSTRFRFARISTICFASLAEP